MFSSSVKTEARTTWQLAGPVMLAQLSVMGMGLVDTLMVGPLGERALGAVALGNSLYNTVVISLTGIVIILDAMIGMRYGADEREVCGQTMWQGYWISLMFGVPLTALFVDSEWMGLAMGQSPEISRGASEYLYGRTWSTLFVLIFAAQRAFVSGIGNTKVVLYIVLVANVVNALGDVALIYGAWGAPELGVEGCGWATTGAQLVMVALGIWVVHFGAYRQGYGVGFCGLQWTRIRYILDLGVPYSLHLFVEIGAFAAAAVMAGWLPGDTPLAAHQIALTLASTTFMVPLGLNSAASIRVGQCIGAGNIDGAALAGRVSLGIGALCSVFFATMFIVFPETLARCFVNDQDVIDASVSLLRVAGLFQISDAFQVVSSGCLRGTGETKIAFLVNTVAHWGVGIPVGYILAFVVGLKAPGIWLGLTTGLTVAAIILTTRFLIGRWRSRVAVANSA